MSKSKPLPAPAESDSESGRYSQTLKREVLEQAFSGRLSFQSLASQYGIHLGTIYRWVKAEREAPVFFVNLKMTELETAAQVTDLQAYIKELEERLAQSALKMEGYQFLIAEMEKEVGRDLRKKSGPKRSSSGEPPIQD